MGCPSTTSISPIAVPIYAGQADPDDRYAEHPAKGRRPRRKMRGNRVLLLGKLRELALYRAEFLRERGFEVNIPGTSQEAVTEILGGAFDVAVLSYTLSNEEVHSLAELVRQSCPDCPLITISTTGRIDFKVNPDLTVLAEDGPSGLIGALQKLRNHN